MLPQFLNGLYPHDFTSDEAYSSSASPHFLLFQIPSKFSLPSKQFRCHPLHESYSESQLDVISSPPLYTMHFVPWCFHSAFPFRYITCIFLSETKDLVIPIVPSSHVTHSRHLIHVFEGVIKKKEEWMSRPTIPSCLILNGWKLTNAPKSHLIQQMAVGSKRHTYYVGGTNFIE